MSDSSQESQSTQQPGPAKSSAVAGDFIKVFLGPTLVNKAVMIYFGLQYAENPGQGYGYGLFASILFLLFICSRFIWRYRNVEDP